VLLRHAREKRRDQARQARRRRERDGATRGIALVRHRRRRPARLRRFRDFSLHQQRNISRRFADGPGVHPACGDQESEAIAVRVPRRVRKRQVELSREILRDLEAAIVQRGERPARAAELQHARTRERLREPLMAARQRS